MGTATGNVIRSLRSTHRGSDLFGGCDQCGKHMSECFVSQSKREYKREDGTVYYGPISGGAYGHKECLEKRFGPQEIGDGLENGARQGLSTAPIGKATRNHADSRCVQAGAR